MSLTATLLDVTDSYRTAAGLSQARLSTVMFNDGKALGRIAAGGDLNTRSYERAMQWLSNNWPADIAWPAGIDRPAPQTLEAANAG